MGSKYFAILGMVVDDCGECSKYFATLGKLLADGFC
jgi:hypothetical protein